MDVWIVRAGEKNVHAQAFVDHGIVAVGWEVFPDDWRAYSADDLRDALIDAGVTGEKAGSYVEEILDFRDRMAVGDLVVTPDPPVVHIGEITGPDRYLPDSPIDEYRQVRTVAWLGSWPREHLPEPLLREANRRSAIGRPREQAEQWLDLARRLRVGDLPPAAPKAARPARDTTGPGRDAPARPARSRPAKAAAPARPKQATPAMLLCPSCHCRLPATRFSPGSEVCTDCE